MRKTLLLILAMVASLTAWAQSGNWSRYKASSFSVIDENAKTISITNEAELALLGYNSRNGYDYSGYTITLTADLDMSATIGTILLEWMVELSTALSTAMVTQSAESSFTKLPSMAVKGCSAMSEGWVK